MHHDEVTIEGTLVATESCCSGKITVRAPTAEEQASAQQSADNMEDIAKLYPPSKPPFRAAGSRVLRISNNGVFELANGDRVYMDGVSCPAAGLEYIRKLVLDEDTIVIVSRRSPGTPSPAELWSATDLKGLDSPAYSVIAETALTSGWCNAVSSATNPQNKRYEALVRLRKPPR